MTSFAAFRPARLYCHAFLALTLSTVLISVIGKPAAAQVATGTPPFSSVAGGTFDIIDPANLNLHFGIPIYHRAGRGMSFDYVMSYDSSIWVPGTSGSTTSWAPVPTWGWRGQSEALTGSVRYQNMTLHCRIIGPDGLPHMVTYNENYFAGYVDSAGTFHSMPVTTTVGSSDCNVAPVSSGNAQATDGSGYAMSVNSLTEVTVQSRSGITINPSLSPSGSGSIVDTNGNVLTTNVSGTTTTFTDTLGTTALTVSGSGTPGSPVVYTYTAPDGASATVTMNYSAYTVQTNFGAPGISEYPATSVVLVSSINLPNGTSYNFTYEPTPGFASSVTGRIASIKLPTGGVISYNYYGGYNGILPDGSASNLHRTTPDGLWAYDRNGSTTIATDPQGNQTTYTFAGIYETNRTFYQGASSSGNKLAWIDTCWNGVCNASSVTLPITQKLTYFHYSSSFYSATATTYNSLGLPTNISEYDFPSAASPAKRVTAITYANLGNNILDRPASVVVEDGANPPNIKSQTNYQYDEASYCCIANAGATPQHVAVSGARGNVTTVSALVSGTTFLSRHFSYFDTGALNTVSDPKGGTTTFNYPDAASTCGNAFPASVSLPLGITTSNIWNCAAGATAAATDANNQKTTYSYDNLGRLIQTTQPDSVQINTQFNDTANPPAITQSTTANSAVRMTTLDTLGREAQSQLQNGTTIVSTVATQYDSLGRPYKTSNPYGPSDAQVWTISSYDALNRPLTVTPPSGGAYQWNYAGNAITTTDPAGKQRRSFSDAMGRLTQVDEPSPGTTSPGSNGSGSINVSGALLVTNNPGTQATGSFTVSGTEVGTRTWICYDTCVRGPFVWDKGYVSVTVNGRMEGVDYGGGSTSASLASSLAATFNADAGSPVSAYYPGSGSTVYLTSKQAGPNWSLTAASDTYDAADFGGPSFSVSVSGAALTGGIYPTTTYDSGTVSVTVGGFRAAASYNQNVNNTAQQMAAALANALNAAGSPVSASASGTTINLTANTYGNGTNYSVTGSATASFAASSTTLAGGADPLSAFYAYDVLDDLTTITQGAQTRSYAYDGMGRLTSATTPESGTLNYSYRAADGSLCSGDSSQVCSATDARGVITTTTYDGLNRPAQVSYNVGSSGVPATPSVGFSYGNNPAANNNGRLATMTDGAGSESYSYDLLGRITQAQRVTGGAAYNTGYHFNAAGELDQITYPSGRMVTQGYDSMGRLNQIASSGSVYLSGLNYNAAGQLLGASYGSGVVGTFGYNDHLQISSLKYDKGSSNLLNLSYGYGGSNNGQIQSITDGRGAAYSASYSYDELGRLSQAQTNDLTAPNTWKLAFGYDRYGNRLSQTLTGGTASITQPQLTVDASTNRISSTGFVYDAAGNLTNDSLHTYSFNVESEITAVDGGTTASYAYDGNRWRVQKTVAGASTTYVYSGSKVIAEYAGGVLSKEYIYSGGQLLATISGGITNYQYADQLSTRMETDSSGAITRTFGHYPFGESWYETGAVSKWKFTSYERDSESGLDYALNRFDSSRLGRFMSPDLLSGSITAPQSLNRYSYVLNDPIGLVDPLGTGPCDPEDYSPEDCAALTAFQNHGLGAGAGGAGDSNNSYLIFRPGRQDNGGDGRNGNPFVPVVEHPGSAIGIGDSCSAGLDSNANYTIQPSSIRPIRLEFSPDVAHRLSAAIAEINSTTGIIPQIGQGTRTLSDQNYFISSGLGAQLSYHTAGGAVDFNGLSGNVRVQQIMESHRFFWGGNFISPATEPWHFDARLFMKGNLKTNMMQMQNCLDRN